jgi:hypothetical protein
MMVESSLSRGDAGMAQLKATNNRFFSIAGFSLLFAYLLSFLFEGQVLYSMLAYNNVLGSPYILVAIIAHFVPGYLRIA